MNNQAENLFKPDATLIKKHLTFLFKGTKGRIEISILNQSENFTDIDKAVARAVSWNEQGKNVYVVGSSIDPECMPVGRSNDADFYETSVVWCDLDGEFEPERLKELYTDCPPQLSVITGRTPNLRAHLWWKLDKPCSDADKVKTALTGIQQKLGGDPAVKNVTSLMRLGGTIAWPKKDGRITEMTEVKETDNVEPHSIEYILSCFPMTGVSSASLVDPSMKNIITDTYKLDALLEATKIEGEWNRNMFTAVGSMVGRGWSDEQIRFACAPYSRGGANDTDVIELIHRTRIKFEQPEENEKGTKTSAITESAKEITALNIKDIDLDDIPPRSWLFGNIAARKFVTIIGASAGAGKSIFTMQMGVCASRDVLFGSHKAEEPDIKTWIYNNEEGEEELRRRLKGVLMHTGVSASELEDRFYMNSGEDQSICIAKRSLDDGGVIHTPDYDALKAEVLNKGIDLLIVDPFAETHALSENSNDEIKEVARLYRNIAIDCNCAVVLVHHTRKGGTGDSDSSEQGGSADNLRGGGAQIGVARRVFTLSKMDKKTAKKFSVCDTQKRYFVKLEDAKSNISAPAEFADWYKFKSIHINNGTMIHEAGDSVGVLVHKTVEEIQDQEGAHLEQEYMMLLTRVARVMIKNSYAENSVSKIVADLKDDGYSKYAERKLKDFLPESIEKIGSNREIISEGYRCRFSIIQGETKRAGNRICLHITQIEDF